MNNKKNTKHKFVDFIAGMGGIIGLFQIQENPKTILKKTTDHSCSDCVDKSNKNTAKHNIEIMETTTKYSSLKDLKDVACRDKQLEISRTATNTVIVDGNTHANVCLIGEAPGQDEDKQGLPFVGKAGKLLNMALESASWSRKKDLFITNAVWWRPEGNRTPSMEEIIHCRKHLHDLLYLLQPEYILLLGKVAAKSVLSIEDTVSLSSLRHKIFNISIKDFHTKVVKVTFHPAYIIRQLRQKELWWQDILEFKQETTRNNNIM